MMAAAIPVQAGELPEGFIDLPGDVQAVILEYVFFPEQANRLWGADLATPSAHTLVKYLDDYHTQVVVDFGLGKIRVENRGGEQPLESMARAIEAILLTPADPTAVDLYTASEFGLTGKPFLLGQVLDQTGQQIEYPWRARQFSRWLLQNRVQHTANGYQISLDMTSNRYQVSARSYMNTVNRVASRFGLAPALILAIIETESSFNPFAISPAPAYGLMQVMRGNAGKDVYQRIYQRSDQPGVNDLMDPHANIEIGSAYLSLLRDVYLGRIEGAERQEFCMIAAYNGGAGNLLRMFDANRERAISHINALSPQQLFDAIVRRHPREETRHYLRKVTTARGRYAAG